MDRLICFVRACLWIVLVLYPLGTLVNTETISACMKMKDTNYSGSNQSVANVTSSVDSAITYHLYKSNTSLTWCQSFHACEDLGLKLAVLKYKQDQDLMSNFGLNDVDSAWVAGRRKDFGTAWTWINDNLDNCTTDCKNISDSKGCGGIDFLRGSFVGLLSVDCYSEDIHLAVCNNGNRVDIESFDEALQKCVSNNSRLADLETASKYVTSSTLELFIGLRQWPWLWIEPEYDYSPVYNTSWPKSPYADDTRCITIGGKGKWVAKNCSSASQYLICQHELQATTTESSTSSTTVSAAASSGLDLSEGTRNAIIGGVLGFLCLIAIVVIVIVCMRRKRARKGPINNNGQPAENTGSNENPYVDSEASPPGGANPPESTAYRPTRPNPKTEYAEVGMTNATFVADPGPGYTLATAPGGPGPAEPAYAMARDPKAAVTTANGKAPREPRDQYSTVQKPYTGDDLTITDNVTYAPYTTPKPDAPASQGKNPKPKPPRTPKPTV